MFRANIAGDQRAGPWQTKFAPYSYNVLNWSPYLNEGGYFSGGVWRPPAGHVWLSAHVAISNSPAGDFPVAKLFKNGVTYYPDTGTGIAVARGIPGQWVCELPAWPDKCDGDDTYELKFFTTGSATIVDGIGAHTWWAGIAYADAPAE